MYWSVLLIWSAVVFGKYFMCASAQPRIFGGQDTTIEDHPYQVAILRNKGFKCGGSLIKSSIVLTAAHCMYGKASRYSIRAGSNSTQSGGQIIKVIKFCNHPRYVGLKYILDYDVSILKLDHPVTLSNQVDIIKLQPVGIAVPDGTNATAIGWGQTENSKTAKVLQSVTLKKLSQDKCVNIMKPYAVTSRMTCYTQNTKNTGTCYGDSGGPLIVSGKQVGITSWSKEPCGIFPNVFVSLENKSIRQHIEEVIST